MNEEKKSDRRRKRRRERRESYNLIRFCAIPYSLNVVLARIAASAVQQSASLSKRDRQIGQALKKFLNALLKNEIVFDNCASSLDGSTVCLGQPPATGPLSAATNCNLQFAAGRKLLQLNLEYLVGFRASLIILRELLQFDWFRLVSKVVQKDSKNFRKQIQTFSGKRKCSPNRL